MDVYASSPFAIHALQNVLSGEAIGHFIVSDLAIQLKFFQFSRLLLSECINNPYSSHLLQLPNKAGIQHKLHKSSSFRLA